MKKISTRARAWATITLSSVLVVAACGSEENADPPATSAAVANTVPATILPPPTSAAEPSTTAPTTTPETTPPTSASASTQPVDGEAAAKQAVIEAAEHAWYVFNEAKLDPTNDEKFNAALAAHTGAARVGVVEVLMQYRSSGQRSVTSETLPSLIMIEPASVAMTTTDSASVEFCRVGSNVLVQTAGNPDGSDLVLDETINAYRERETYVLRDGVWLNSDVELLEKYEGSYQCEPSA